MSKAWDDAPRDHHRSPAPERQVNSVPGFIVMRVHDGREILRTHLSSRAGACKAFTIFRSHVFHNGAGLYDMQVRRMMIDGVDPGSNVICRSERLGFSRDGS
jgi:hypothetical protein